MINYNPDPDGESCTESFLCPYCGESYPGFDYSEGMLQGDTSTIDCENCGGVFTISVEYTTHYNSTPLTPPPPTSIEEQ